MRTSVDLPAPLFATRGEDIEFPAGGAAMASLARAELFHPGEVAVVHGTEKRG